MFKKLLLASLFICLYTIEMINAQSFNENAPWLKKFQSKSNSNSKPTFQDIQNAFNEYWKTNDPNKKGSGYKPFKRWEYMWETVVNDEGYLPTIKDQWIAWENKKKAQSRSSRADQSNWLPLGPQTHTNTGSWSSGQARTNAIIVDPNDSDVWYVGTPAGGLWKSINAGNTWVSLTDDLPQIGVSGIAIDNANSNIVYIATGDDDASDTVSAGVFKSTDGGASWNQTGLNPQNTPSAISEIYIHPTNSDILWIASNNGIYKSINAGTDWALIMSGNVLDLKLKPGNPNTIYAVTSNRFFKSINGGNSFTETTNGMPQNSGRMVIDVTPANDAYVYLLSVKASDQTFNGVYRSTDSGDSFTSRNVNTDVIESAQAYYDLALGVSSTNAEEIYVGCLNVWKSSDGGNIFNKVNEWNQPTSSTYTHADIHTIRAFGNRIFVCSDGGIYASTDSGANFTDYTAGIQASQFYKIAVAKNDANKMVGGLQDNGGHAYNHGNGNWLNYYGADGMDTAINSINDDKYYGFIQNGRALCISNNAGSNFTSEVQQPVGSSGNWVTPLEVNSQGKVFAAYNRLYRLNDNETAWVQLANLSGVANHMKISPSNDQIMYVAVDAILNRSSDSGVSVSNVHNFNRTIKGIAIHDTDPNRIWVTTSSTVHYSSDGGDTFSNITKNLPVTDRYVFINDIVHQPGHEQDPIYIGTSIGVYRSTTDGKWDPFFNGLPTTIINDLEINTLDNSITVATYGRGIWRSQLPNCISIATTQNAYLDDSPSENVNNIRSCVGQKIELEALVTKGDNPAYNWNGPNGFLGTTSSITLDNIDVNNIGEYTVAITSPSTCSDAVYTYTVDVEENAIQPERSIDYTICSNETVTLTATGSAGYKWYDSMNTETELAIGASFTSPLLSETRTYYVAGTAFPTMSEIVSSPEINTAADYDRHQGLIFDTTDDIILESFTVSAMSSGQRTIDVVDSFGSIVATKTLNIPKGQSLVIVNLEIPKGTNHTLRIGGNLVEMRRTPSGNGVTYPYASPNGIVSITGNTANAPEFYYFFYDWNIKSKGGFCESARTPVNVIVDGRNMFNSATYTIDNGTTTNFADGDEITFTEGANLSLNLPKASVERELTWTSPSGETYTTETVNLTNLRNNGAEEGEWSLEAKLNLEHCEINTQKINFFVNIDNKYKELTVFPNPVKDILTIGNINSLQGATLYIYDTNGRKVIDSYSIDSNNPHEIALDLQNLEAGTYFINVESNGEKLVKMFVKQKK